MDPSFLSGWPCDGGEEILGVRSDLEQSCSGLFSARTTSVMGSARGTFCLLPRRCQSRLPSLCVLLQASYAPVNATRTVGAALYPQPPSLPRGILGMGRRSGRLLLSILLRAITTSRNFHESCFAMQILHRKTIRMSVKVLPV